MECTTDTEDTGKEIEHVSALVANLTTRNVGQSDQCKCTILEDNCKVNSKKTVSLLIIEMNIKCLSL